MTAPTARVELLVSPYSSFFEYFTLDDDALGILDEDVLADDSVLVDITSYVRSISIRRGREYDLEEFRSGTCHILLNNDARVFDPSNTASIFYGNIEPMRRLYVTGVVGGTDYPLYRGFLQRCAVDYSDQNLPLASFEAADSLAILANQQLASIAAAHSGDLAGARVSRVLDRAEVGFPSDLRSIATGDTTMGPTTFGTNAATYLQLVAKSEGGALYVSKTGVLTFEARSTGPGTNKCTFSDDGDAANVPYLTIDQDMGVDLLYNQVKTSGTSGSEQVVSDADSINAYQVRTLDRTGQLALNDSDMLGQANYLLGRFKVPELRLRQVVVRADSLATARQVELLGLELTDRVTVERTPPGGGTPSMISQAALVDGIDWSITDGGTSWLATVTMSTGAAAVGFILDDDDFGQLDDDLLIY